MTAACIDELVKTWACDEVARQAFGTEYRVAVTWVPVQPPGAPPGVAVPSWYMTVTTRNPVLGEPRLCHTTPIGMPEPDEKVVRESVALALRALRDLVASKLSGVNGGGSVAAR